jgi:uncharacterized protein (DUF433 family)
MGTREATALKVLSTVMPMMQAPTPRITIDPAFCHHKLAINGLRFPVEMILDLLVAGMSHIDTSGEYPGLESGDISATLEYASHLTSTDRQ